MSKRERLSKSVDISGYHVKSSGPPSLRLRALASQDHVGAVGADPRKEHWRAIEILAGITVSLTIVLGFLVHTAMDGSEHLRAGITAAQAGDSHQAVQELTASLASRGAPLEAYEYRAMAYGKTGDHGLAASDYSHIIAARPNDADAYMGRACQRLQNFNYQDAADDFTKVLKLDPKQIDAYRLRAAAQWKLKNFQQVVEDCNAYMKSGDKLPVEHQVSTLLLLASALQELNQPTEAIDACRQAIAQNGNDPRPLEKRSRLLKQEHKLAEAIDDCTAALKVTADPDLLMLRAECYVDQGDKKSAMKDLNEAVKILPNDLKARNQRAELAMSTQDYKLAIEDAEFTLAAAPSNREATEIFQHAKKLTGADKVKVITTDYLHNEIADRSDIPYIGSDTRSDTYKGYKLLVSGREAEAVPILTGAIRSNPNNIMARKYLAHALLGSGQEGEALKQFTELGKTIDLAPEDWLAFAQAAAICGKQELSMSSYERYLALIPTNREARLALIEQYQHKGDTAKAQAVAREGIRLSHTPDEKGFFARAIRGPLGQDNTESSNLSY